MIKGHLKFNEIINKEWNWCDFLSLVVAMIIITLSLTPLTQGPETVGSDKNYHFLAYGILAAPTSFGRASAIFKFAIFYIVFGACVEVLQPFVGRSGDMSDVLMNSFGVFVGSCVGYTARRIL